MGRATWETFSGNHSQSYWIQYTDTFGGSIEFINDQWYHIFWSNTINSYFTEGNQFIKEPELVGLGSLAELLKTQRTTGGKKHDRHKDLSTQGSSKHSVSSKTQGGNNSCPHCSDLHTADHILFDCDHLWYERTTIIECDKNYLFSILSGGKMLVRLLHKMQNLLCPLPDRTDPPNRTLA